jgi:cysteine synthase A
VGLNLQFLKKYFEQEDNRMKLNHILEDIGNTAHVRLNRLFSPAHEVWLKLERSNPGGSIKDRIALAMVEQAEKEGKLKKGGIIIEPTSGNTGVGLALVAAVKGYRLLLVMPDSMSLERRRLMAAYGAELVLTPGEQGMKGAIEKARELHAQTPGSWMPMQFENTANVRIHQESTAQEILADFPDGLDVFVSGVGTGGHITGIALELKKVFPNLKVVAVEPENSAVLSGRSAGAHKIQGIGAGFVPAILRTDLLDEVVPISNEEAFEFTRRLAREEGVLGGISTGASLAAVEKILRQSSKALRVLTVNYDTGERYLSQEGLF